MNDSFARAMDDSTAFAKVGVGTAAVEAVEVQKARSRLTLKNVAKVIIIVREVFPENTH